MVTRKLSVRSGNDIIEVVAHRSVEEFDTDLMQQLRSDRTLVSLSEIAEMCGVAEGGRQAVTHWKRATDNYLLRGHREWPPAAEVLRRAVSADPDATSDSSESTVPVRNLPAHQSVLPPPAVSGGGTRGQHRWYRGDIYLWGWRTRRISFTGQPLVGEERRAGRDLLAFTFKVPRRIRA